MKRWGILLFAVGYPVAVGVWLRSDIKDFLWTHPWWHSFLVALPDVAVPILAAFELHHSHRANDYREEANRYRREANRLTEEGNQLRDEANHQREQASVSFRQLQHLQQLAEIAANTKKPLTWSEKNARVLREHIGESVSVTENESSWGGLVKIVEVSDDSSIFTLFVPAGYSSTQAWSQQIDCGYVEITTLTDRSLRLHVRKRYGKHLELGDITNWEDRSTPVNKAVFAKGELAYRADYAKNGVPEKRTLMVYGSAEGANSFLLEASPGGTFVADNIELSKKLMVLQVDYRALGFEIKDSRTGSQPYPLFL